MNEALRKALSTYYWDSEYIGNIIRYSEADEKLGMLLSNLKRHVKGYPTYEADINNLCCWYEYEGLLQGYVYCLTMIGLYNEKAPQQPNGSL